MRQVARELGVQYVLEGSLQIDGDQVRITAQLIDATTGNHVWAERYDRPLDDVFAMQDEVTQTIAGSSWRLWHGAMARAGREVARRKPPNRPSGLRLLLARGSSTSSGSRKEDNQKAQELSEEGDRDRSELCPRLHRLGRRHIYR